MIATLELQDGNVFKGRSFGAASPASGEVVFNTGMVGYPEALTDPSYRGQILVFTYPLIGNYGVPSLAADRLESGGIQVAGVVVAGLSAFHLHSDSDDSLDAWMRAQGIPGIRGIDTRAVTRHLRSSGTMLGRLLPEGADCKWDDPNARNLLPEVSQPGITTSGRGDKVVILVDLGCKRSIEASLLARGLRVKRVPWDHPFAEEDGDAVVLSSGPGDPRNYGDLIATVARELRNDRPILGICLGHQALGLAAGGEVYKLPFGHRGQNQPCLEVGSRRCVVTSQNHGYALDVNTIANEWKPWFFNGNDGSCEGILHRERPILAVQFHPEAHPGPGDTAFVFDRFLELVRDA